jgi:hypothetical protein
MGIALGLYWSGIAQAMVVIAAISALGAIGGLPALLNTLIKHTRFSIRWLRGLYSHAAATNAPHAACNKV